MQLSRENVLKAVGNVCSERPVPGLVLSSDLPEHRIRNIRDDRAYLGYPESEHVGRCGPRAHDCSRGGNIRPISPHVCHVGYPESEHVAHGHICAPRARQCCIWNIPTGSHVCRPLVHSPHDCRFTPHVCATPVRVVEPSPLTPLLAVSSQSTCVHGGMSRRGDRMCAMRTIARQNDAVRMFRSQIFVPDHHLFGLIADQVHMFRDSIPRLHSCGIQPLPLRACCYNSSAAENRSKRECACATIRAPHVCRVDHSRAKMCACANIRDTHVCLGQTFSLIRKCLTSAVYMCSRNIWSGSKRS